MGEPAPDFMMVNVDELRGHPVLVHFWSVSSHICHENMPTIAEWRDARMRRAGGDAGLGLLKGALARQFPD